MDKQISPVFYRTSSPLGPLPCLLPNCHFNVDGQSKGTADHLLPLGDWFLLSFLLCWRKGDLAADFPCDRRRWLSGNLSPNGTQADGGSGHLFDRYFFYACPGKKGTHS